MKSVKHIDAAAFKKGIKECEKGEKPHYIIDVREKNELESIPKIHERVLHIPRGHIKNAFDMDEATFKKTYGLEYPELEAPIFFYCAGGMRSAMAGEYLVGQHGYENVYNLVGGAMNWYRSNMSL